MLVYTSMLKSWADGVFGLSGSVGGRTSLRSWSVFVVNVTTTFVLPSVDG